MTTRVTITVPAKAEYYVVVETKSQRGDQSWYDVYGGEEYTVYIHDGLKIVEIKEVPLEFFDDYVYEECVHEGE